MKNNIVFCRVGFGRRIRGRFGFRGGMNNAAQSTGNAEFYSYDKETLEKQKTDLEEQLQWIDEQLKNLKEEN